jgi:PAS domain S-box-containing protein
MRGLPGSRDAKSRGHKPGPGSGRPFESYGMNLPAHQMPSGRARITAGMNSVRVILYGLLVLSWAVGNAACHGLPSRNMLPHRVLVLHSYHKGLAWTDGIARGIEDKMRTAGVPVEIFHEFMDTRRNCSQQYLDELIRLYRIKYTDKKPDLIISSDDDAFHFLRHHRQEMFGSMPVVFCGVNFFEGEMLLGLDQFTGTLESIDIRATLNIALTLHPEAERLVVLMDQTQSAQSNKKLLVRALPELKRSMQVTWLDDHDMGQVLDFVSTLTNKDIIVWLAYTINQGGRYEVARQSSRLISSYSKAPLYSFWDVHLGYGIVGGMLSSGYQQGTKAAQICLRILNGFNADDIPVEKNSPSRFMFDYRELSRFDIDQGMLPYGSAVINRPPTFYSKNKSLFWAIVLGFTGLAAVIVVQLVNLTARDRSEAALKTAKTRYQNMFNSSAMALFEADCKAIRQAVDRMPALDREKMAAYLNQNREKVRQLAALITITDVNPAAVQLYGAKNKADLMRSVDKILAPGFYKTFSRILTAVSQGDRQFSCETSHRTLHGSPLHLILSINLPAEPEDYAHLTLILVDITDRKRSEDALRRSETRFRTMFNHAASGMALVNLRGRYLRVNAALCRMLGYQPAEILKKTWQEVTHPDDIAETKKALQRLRQGHISSLQEKRYINARGQTVWALLNAALIRDHDRSPLYYVSQIQDITPMKQAQSKLQEREERYRQIFEADLSGFYITNPKGDLIMCNQVFATILGFASIRDALGADFNSFYKDPGLRPRVLDVLARKRKIKHREVEFVRRDGSTAFVILNATGRFDSEGNLIEIYGYLMDITHQKKLEYQLLHAQKMESIGTMAGGLAHDFNNLLMGIMGNASLLMAQLDETHPGYKFLKSIEQYVHSGSELTRQLLGFAKGGSFQVRTVDLNQLIERNINMFARTNKKIRVETSLQKDLWLVEADASQIDQVLCNLYVNAWQAMENGGDLHIETCNRQLRARDIALEDMPPGRYVQISVTDTGTGMDRETIKRIFDPFFTTKQRGQGTGLGLASAYNIIKNHGGFITVSSVLNKGSTFAVYLPASHATELETEPTEAAQVTSGSETILLVDDEDNVIAAMGNLLTHMGYTVHSATSGKEALEIFKNKKDAIDLVILDMVMPGMSGSETFDQLRAIDPAAKVLLCSGYSADDRAARLLKSGCEGFMQKPFSMRDLSHKLKEIFTPRP